MATHSDHANPTNYNLTRARSLVLVAALLSGAAGLGYEIVWTRQLGLSLGHEIIAVLAVLMAFLTGLAAGAWLLDRSVSKTRSPVRWYVGLEIIAGCWGIGTGLALPWLADSLSRLLGPAPDPIWNWLATFTLPLLVLGPATVAIGATFPCLERILARYDTQSRVVGQLYAVNTFGAVLGTLLATFFLVRWLGTQASLLVLAGANFTAAAIIAGLKTGDQRPQSQRPPGRLSPGRGVILFCTGFLGLAYEVICIRVTAEVTENTVYSFGSALVLFLTGTAIGAAACQRWGNRYAPDQLATVLLAGLALACAISTSFLFVADDIYRQLLLITGSGLVSAICAEMGLAALVFLGPTILMGAVFALLAQSSRHNSGGVGAALGVNTLGAAMAPPVVALALLPALGAKLSLILVSLGYLLLVPQFNRRVVVLGVSTLAVTLLQPGELRLIHLNPGEKLLDYKQGVMASVAVIENQRGDRLLKVNDQFTMGGDVSVFAESRQAHLPLLLHPKPRQVLLLGLGAGYTAHAAAQHPGTTVTAVELIPEIVAALPFFQPRAADADALPYNVAIADARRWVRADSRLYDVIIADLYQPARDGAGALYTREHFQAVADRLGPGGLFCQWLPLYQLDLPTFKMILRTFLSTFQEGTAVLSHFNVATPAIGLIGWRDERNLAPDWFNRRVSNVDAAPWLLESAIYNDLTLFGGTLADTAALQRLAGQGPLNTDDHPRVIYEAPELIYDQSASRHELLFTLLSNLAEDADPIAETLASLAQADRANLARYANARNTFLLAEIERLQGNEPGAIDGYIDALVASADFTTAYAAAYRLAQRQHRSGDTQQAVSILNRLITVAPDRDEAVQLRQQLLRH